MSRWIDIGYKWNTETTYRVREFLKENGIPMRMPSDEMFFQSMYHLPHRDRLWGIKVRKKDLARIRAMLAKEELIHSPVRQTGEIPKREPAGTGRLRISLYPAGQKKRWPEPRPGTGNV